LVDVPFEAISVDLYRPTSRQRVQGYGGQSGLVPVLIDGELAIWDTLAITESLYEVYPQIWPQAYAQRARARSYAGEVHSGLNALRHAMPVNARGRNRLAVRTTEVDADIARVCQIWATAGRHRDGPWLFGRFCAADIMFAPVATRFVTYDVAPTPAAAAYWERLLTHPLVVEWLALARGEPQVIEHFELPANASSP
jgi:glutathione S-transferase